MLETLDLTKHFKEVKAVDSINLFIERGEIVGLLGPNGAGKTTAIAMIAALIPPTRGEVLLYGKSVIASPAPLRQILGMVPQQLALYPDLTARENLQFFGRSVRSEGEEPRGPGGRSVGTGRAGSESPPSGEHLIRRNAAAAQHRPGSPP